VDAQLPAGFPQRVVDAIFAGLQDAAAKLQQMPPA
jgi:hypothetical protein